MADWEWHYLLNAVEQAWKISLPPAETEQIVHVKHLLAVVKKQVPAGFAKEIRV